MLFLGNRLIYCGYALAVSLIFINNTLAQNTIGGRVVNVESKPLVGAIILLQQKSDSSIVDYASTNTEGKWSTTLPKSNLEFLLQFKMLGYKTKYVTIENGATQQNIDTVILEEDITLLKGVAVKAKREGILQKGDTLQYDIELFNTGTERTLKDILENLPGVSITENGDINYNGKRINNLLLEGKDILNNQHKLASEGIQANYIRDVQIIENFKEGAEQLFESTTNKTAMNVRLKEEAKGKLIGDVALAGGYKNKLNGKSNLIHVKAKNAFTNFGRYNNTGTAAITLMDYLSLQPSSAEWLREGINVSEVLPENFLIPHYLNANNDALIAQNNHWEFSKKNSLKASVLVSRLDRESAYDFNRDYWRTQANFVGENNRFDVSTIIQSTIKHTYKNEKRTRWLEIEIPVFIEESSNKSQLTGQFNSTPTALNNILNASSLHIAPFARYTHQISKNVNWSNELRFTNKHQNSIRTLDDTQTLFETDSLGIEQSLESDNTLFNFQSRIEYKIHKNHSVGIKYIFREITIDSEATSEIASFLWDNRLKRRTQTVHGYYRSDTKKWKTNFFIEGTDINSSLSQGNFNTLYVNSRLGIEYKMGILNSLHFSVATKSNPLPLDILNNQPIIKNGQMTIKGLNRLDTLSQSFSASTTYIHFNQQNFQRKFLSFIYSRNNNRPIADNIIFNNYTQQSWQLAEFEQNWQLNGQIQQPLLKNTLIFYLDGMFNIQKTVVSERDVIYSNMFQVSPRVKTNLWQKFTMSTQLTGNLITTRQTTTTLENDFLRLELKNQFSYKTKKWFFEGVLRLNRNYLNSEIANDFWNLDVELSYQLNKNWTLGVTGNNVNNISGLPDVNVLFQPNFIQETNFMQFPGFVLFKISYLL